jgi:hypothetical protein
MGPAGLLLPAGLGALESIGGMIGLLKEAKKPYPKYGVSSELQGAYDRAQGEAQFGYSGAEKAAFHQDLARANSLRLQRGLALAGGSLGSAVNAATQSSDISALNNFAASDEAVRRQKISYADTLAQAVQRQKNLETQNQIQRKVMMEQAYGGALKAGLTNITNGIGGYMAYKYNPLGTGITNSAGKTGGAISPSLPLASDSAGKPIVTPSVADVFNLGAELDLSK